MHDWATTDKVLAAIDDFNNNLGIYHLAAPQLLFTLNTSAAYRVDPHAVITAGADKVHDTILNLTRRIEANERDARARDADTKHRFNQLDNSIGVITTLASTLTNRQEEMGRALFTLQHDTQLSIDLACVDNNLVIARQTFFGPIDDTEKEQARTDIEALKATRTDIAARLDALRGNAPLIAAPGPAIPPPNTSLAVTPSPATLPPNPATTGSDARPPKRPCTSVDGPDPSPSAIAVHSDDLEQGEVREGHASTS
ncbi:hypothetical protein B0H17DRAFT_1191497 [Mycena rosella]|uniref:Uncharacterized protein n=1 Tax=Mycena rosella TaxID=1033263 RepID=A0AAD7H0D5_MYCRO|nr:hypothetical protein B0H17DRAFT_1191497 [Mycena rosella]